MNIRRCLCYCNPLTICNKIPAPLARFSFVREYHVAEDNHNGNQEINRKSKVFEENPKDFNPKNILLLRKITRYEYEKKLRPSDSEEELKLYLTTKGSNYQGLLERHDEYHKSLDNLQNIIVKNGLDLRVVKRYDYTLSQIDWADAIMTAGGDGTFLMASTKVNCHSKPVIGINTDPIRSEGVLCLPKSYSLNMENALNRILSGRFKWMWRHRIRIVMDCGDAQPTQPVPVNLHDQELMYPEHRFWEHVKENEMFHDQNDALKVRDDLGISVEKEGPSRVLPILALNEVFIGESLSARMSFYEMSINNSQRVKQKSSGITVCTGTGSTSWFFNINYLPKDSVRELFKIASEYGGSIKSDIIPLITQRFNNSLKFDPSFPKMAYAIRDPVAHGLFQVNKSRGFCDNISIKSRMWDAWVVVDGGMSFHFNDGALLNLEMHEEDALRCVSLS